MRSVRVEKSFEAKLKNGYRLHSGLPPDSGTMLAYVLRMLDGRSAVPDDAGLDAVRLVEASESARGEMSRLGDRAFVNASQVSPGNPRKRRIEMKPYV